MEKSNESQRIVVVSSGEKSMAATILLTLFFGPLGLFYSSVAGGIVMLILSIIVAVFTLGFGLIITQLICVIWGAIATNSHNQKMRDSFR